MVITTLFLIVDILTGARTIARAITITANAIRIIRRWLRRLRHRRTRLAQAPQG